MIYDRVDINVRAMFEVDLSNYKTWDDYYQQYKTVFQILCNLAKKEKYQMNKQFMPFMFVFRHTVELFLKKEGATVDTHNINELICQLPEFDAKTFLSELSVLNCDSDGDCFRYVSDNNHNPHYNGGQLKVLPAINYFLGLIGDSGYEMTNKLDDEYTFHTNEIKYLGVIATQYEYTVSYLISLVNDGKCKMEDCCLPLLFLMRHALELKAKQNVYNLIEQEKGITKLKITHSLEHLEITKLSKFYSDATSACNDPTLKQKIIADTNAINQMVKQIQKVDPNSYRTRFPVNKHGNTWNSTQSKINVAAIYDLIKDCDSIQSFGIDYLLEENII